MLHVTSDFHLAALAASCDFPRPNTPVFIQNFDLLWNYILIIFFTAKNRQDQGVSIYKYSRGPGKWENIHILFCFKTNKTSFKVGQRKLFFRFLKEGFEILFIYCLCCAVSYVYRFWLALCTLSIICCFYFNT
jgi:hypothetical protein